MKQKISEAIYMLIAAFIASIPLKYVFRDSYKNTLIYTIITFAIMYLVGIIIIPLLVDFIGKYIKNK